MTWKQSRNATNLVSSIASSIIFRMKSTWKLCSPLADCSLSCRVPSWGKKSSAGRCLPLTTASVISEVSLLVSRRPFWLGKRESLDDFAKLCFAFELWDFDRTSYASSEECWFGFSAARRGETSGCAVLLSLALFRWQTKVIGKVNDSINKWYN